MNPRIIDLTLTIEEGMQTFPTPWHPYVEITQLGRHGIENRETRKLVLGTHTGTHMDAPRHFIRRGATVDAIPLEQLVGTATVVNFATLPDHTPITPAMLLQAVGELPWERLALRFDWDRHLGTNRYYTDHPFLEEETARLLLEKKCLLLAMDTPQPDNPQNGRGTPKDSPIHKILLGNGVILVEYLIGLAGVRGNPVQLVVAPLKIRDGDGAPVRCFVIETPG
ncbi:MAG: cyclase family protein [Magnetococcales bacterium]|nr:cyclase family protein [Magnetococcales bacterium]